MLPKAHMNPQKNLPPMTAASMVTANVMTHYACDFSEKVPAAKDMTMLFIDVNIMMKAPGISRNDSS